MIEFKSITKQYMNDKALNDVTLTVDSGELFVLVGPSGSGKTTLLKTVNRLVVPTSGEVLIDGKNVADADLQDLRLHIGYVLQSSALFPNMTILQNAGIQLEAMKWDKDKIRQRVFELLEVADLDPAIYANRMPHELSGGEAQRVGIVRALAADPKLILMDEPFSALDPVSKRSLQNLIIKLHREFKTTIIFVSHDMQEAVRLADRLGVMHDGTLVQVGSPKEVMNHPVDDFVELFFKNVPNVDFDLAQVIASGFGIKAEDQNATKLSRDTTVRKWATMLTNDHNLKIQVGDFLLTETDLIGYVATVGKDDEND